MFGKKKVYNIYLFRHGKTDFNEKGIFTGWKDAKLTRRGILDAKRVAKTLKNKKIEVAIHTRLSRSKDTLKYVLEFHPECKTILKDDRMIERSYGVLEGVKHDKFIHDVGEQIVNLKSHGDAMEDLDLRRREKLERFFGEKEYDVIHRGWATPAVGGESFQDVEIRVSYFIDWLKSYIKKNKVNVAISAHGNSIRLFRKVWEGLSKEECMKATIPYDKVYTYKI
jgi:bisphosphoglycerate-dependent phosphoglycerate mutase family 1